MNVSNAHPKACVQPWARRLTARKRLMYASTCTDPSHVTQAYDDCSVWEHAQPMPMRLQALKTLRMYHDIRATIYMCMYQVDGPRGSGKTTLMAAAAEKLMYSKPPVGHR